MAQKEKLKDEEPMQLGTIFGIKILIIGTILVSIVIGVPYFLMK